MAFLVDKAFSAVTILLINVALILTIEFSGGGKLFFDTGLIHAVAILFSLLGVSRIYFHYYSYDPILEKFIHACLASLLIFAGSHLFEYLSYKVFALSWGAIFVNVGNFYITSLLVIIIGAEFFLRAVRGRSSLFIALLTGAVLLPSASSAVVLANDKNAFFAPESQMLLIYAGIVIFIALFGLSRLAKVKQHASVAREFVNYFMAAFVLISLSTLANFLYLPLKELYGIPTFRSIYVSHFLFFAALSMMFLAFAHLSRLTGIYKSFAK